MVASWAIPVGTLSGLATAMFIFICWWFPRTWIRGEKQERQIIDAERAERGYDQQTDANSLEMDPHKTIELDPVTGEPLRGADGQVVMAGRGPRPKLTFEEALERARAQIQKGHVAVHAM